MRCFNGYIGQGIDDDWNMVCIPFAFQPVTGSHTGQAIKTQYNKVVDEFGIKEKVFKIVTDSAANNKSAFKDQVEASDESHILAKLMLKQKKRDLYHKNKELLKQKENLAVNYFFFFNPLSRNVLSVEQRIKINNYKRLTT